MESIFLGGRFKEDWRVTDPPFSTDWLKRIFFFKRILNLYDFPWDNSAEGRCVVLVRNGGGAHRNSLQNSWYISSFWRPRKLNAVWQTYGHKSGILRFRFFKIAMYILLASFVYRGKGGRIPPPPWYAPEILHTMSVDRRPYKIHPFGFSLKQDKASRKIKMIMKYVYNRKYKFSIKNITERVMFIPFSA